MYNVLIFHDCKLIVNFIKLDQGALSAVSLGARTSLGVHGICTLRAQIIIPIEGAPGDTVR